MGCTAPVLEPAAAFRRLIGSISRTLLSSHDEGRAGIVYHSKTSVSKIAIHGDHFTLFATSGAGIIIGSAKVNLHSEVLSSSIKVIHINGGSFRVLAEERGKGTGAGSASFKGYPFALSSWNVRLCGQSTVTAVVLTNKTSLIR
jgi:hypothetical protein